MGDASRPESGLEFLEPQPPAVVHNNWVMDKLQDYTMKREGEIKGQTMGASLEKVAKMFIQPLIVTGAANLGDNLRTGSLTETLNQISESLPDTLTLIGYFHLVRAYILHNLDTSSKQPRLPEKKYIPSQKMVETLKKIDMSGKNRK